MRLKLFRWLGREFAALSAEGTGATAEAEARDLLSRFDQALGAQGLSLDNVVRTRLWARDRESRSLGGTERVRILAGRARSASASFIAPGHLDSGALLALDLVAMRPSRLDLAKTIVEYEPPIAPVRYIVYDSLVFLSGVTASPGPLGDQAAEILGRIGESLAKAGTSWGKAVLVSCFLHRDHQFTELEDLLPPAISEGVPRVEYVHVDGYAGEGRLLEIEVTATL